MCQPPLCSGVPPPGTRCDSGWGALARLCPLLGCSQSHCRVTQRAHSGLIPPDCPCLPLLRPGTLGAGQQAAGAMPTSRRGSPPRDACSRSSCQLAAPSVSPLLRHPGTAEPRPWAQAGTAPRGGHGHAATRGASWCGGAGFQVPPRCHGDGVAAGGWHNPEPLRGWLCGTATVPSPLLSPMPRQSLGRMGWGAGPGLNPSGIGRGQGTPLFLAPRPHLPWLCLCARCRTDHVPCHAVPCCAAGVWVAGGTHVPG